MINKKNVNERKNSGVKGIFNEWPINPSRIYIDKLVTRVRLNLSTP
ncbi:unnamed protein product, partial [marine sediment metagenome]